MLHGGNKRREIPRKWVEKEEHGKDRSREGAYKNAGGCCRPQSRQHTARGPELCVSGARITSARRRGANLRVQTIGEAPRGGVWYVGDSVARDAVGLGGSAWWFLFLRLVEVD